MNKPTTLEAVLLALFVIYIAGRCYLWLQPPASADTRLRPDVRVSGQPAPRSP